MSAVVGAARTFEKGQRVRVRPFEGPIFDGTIERITAGNHGVAACYLVRRDEPIYVAGFSRSAYWTGDDRMEEIADDQHDQSRFEAQR